MSSEDHGGGTSAGARTTSRALVSAYRAQRLARKQKPAPAPAEAGARQKVAARPTAKAVGVDAWAQRVDSQPLTFAASDAAIAFATTARTAPAEPVPPKLAAVEDSAEAETHDLPVEMAEPAEVAITVPADMPEPESEPEPAVVEEPTTDMVVGSVPEPEPASTRSDVTEADCDLLDLPGAGPGLVWILRRSDIHSLADLSRADPAALMTRLGLIGQLVDVEGWIAFAQSRAPAV